MQTAREVNRLAMLHYEYHLDDSGQPHKKTLPTPEQAEDYVQCVRMLQHYYENIEPLSDEQLKELETKREMYDTLHLDMRNTVFEENGKKGLKSAMGKLLVPALYDAFPELYDDTIYKGWGVQLVQSCSCWWQIWIGSICLRKKQESEHADYSMQI